MKKELRRIGIRRYVCSKEEIYTAYFTWSSTVAPTLMECSSCLEVFIYDEDAVLYGKPLEEEIRAKSCPRCAKPLSITLRKYHFDKKVINCSSPEVSVQPDAVIELFNLYT